MKNEKVYYVVNVWDDEDKYVPLYGKIYKTEEEAAKKASQMLHGFKHAAVFTMKGGKMLKKRAMHVWA